MSADPANEGAPAVHGTVAAGWEPVAEAMATNVAEHGEAGAAVHVLVDGTPVVDCWVGHADADGTRPWTGDTLVNVYSTGKGIGIGAVLALVGDGALGLDAPVATVWPEFAAGGKERVTLRQVLCHRAGLPAIRTPLDDDDLWDVDRMIDHVGAIVPWWEPDTRHAYHTNTYGHLLAGIVRAVTGDDLATVLRHRITGPVDADVHLGVADADLPRCADVRWHGPTDPPDVRALTGRPPGTQGDQEMIWLAYANPPGYSSMGVVNTTAWRRTQLASTNIHASARGVARVYDGYRTHATVPADVLAEAIGVQSSGPCPVLERDVSFGLGFQQWTEPRPLGLGPTSFGHYGTGGTLGFCDPEHGVSFGYVANDVIPRWVSPRNRALVDAVRSCL